MVLAKGDRGDKVEELQAKLKELGLYAGEPDGKYGPKTRNAVIAFQQQYLVDGIVDQVTERALDQAVTAWKQNANQYLLMAVPHGLDAIKTAFGVIEFEEAGAGNIEIINGWAADHIEQVTLPVVGSQLVHKRLSQAFRSVFQNIKDKGLDKSVKQFGCWCPRHKMHNPKRGLSTHSWAIACDINWATNPVGKVGNMDPGIVATFEAHGFNWGGRWKHRDDMHFQFATGY